MRAAWLIVMTVLGTVIGVRAEPASDAGALLLKNGEVFVGQIARQGDRYRITVAAGEVRVRANEVALTGTDVNDLYRQQRDRLSTDNGAAHLDLAEWCLKQNLLSSAAAELADAERGNAPPRRLALLRERLTAVAQNPARPAGVTSVTKPADPLPQNVELDRWIRSLPRGSVETYTHSIQPLLFNSCATAGCHGPRPTSDFVLVRPTANQVTDNRITQRNLQAAWKFVNPEHPEQSPLLKMASTAHGKGAVAGIPLQSPQQQSLADWLAVVVQQPTPGASRTNAPTAALMTTISNAGFAVPGETVDPNAQPQFSGFIRKPRSTKYNVEEPENVVGENAAPADTKPTPPRPPVKPPALKPR